MVIFLNIEKGDYVSRNSYNNDTLFKVINIKDGIYYLKGVDVRLCADAIFSDLKKEDEIINDDLDNVAIKDELLERGDFFYLPPKVLHIDGDEEYLMRCLNFYKKNGILAIGKKISEKNISEQIKGLLNEYKPDIVIITGHDAYYKKKGTEANINNYKNSLNFVEAVKEARRFENSHEKLIIIAGACQSDYEELIKAGANFASSPKRINIHALDPAIVATKMSMADANADINLKEIINNTKYQEKGFGGIITKGTMYMGYPR